MTVERFFKKFELLADAPKAVQRIREIILQLAFSRRLVKSESEWLARPLRSLTSKIGSGATPAGGRESYFSTGIPLIRSMNVHFAGFEPKGLVFLSDAQAEELSTAVVRSDDVLLNITGASIGRVTLAPPHIAGARVNQHVTIIRPTAELLARFLSLFLASPRVQWMIKEIEVGATRQALTKGMIEEFEIPLPPLVEQKRIVAKVDELMAMCDRLEAQQAEREAKHTVLARAALARFTEGPTLASLGYLFHQSYAIDATDLRRSILTLAVQGKLVPQAEGDEPAVELVAKALTKLPPEKRKRVAKPLPPVDDPPFGLPSAWTWARFRDIAFIASNLVDPKLHGDMLHLAPDNIEKGTGTLLPCRTVREDEVKSGNHRFYPGQLVYSKIRPSLSKVVWVAFEGLCSADMYPIDPLIDARYLMRYMLSEAFLRQAVKTDTRVAMPKINQNELNAIAVPVPPLAEQRRIVAKVEQLMTLVDDLEAQLAQSRSVGMRLMDAVVTELTGVQQHRKERMKVPKVEIVSLVRLKKRSTVPPKAPLASLLAKHHGELEAKALWRQSGLAIHDFYKQLRKEIHDGSIADPGEPLVRQRG